MASSSGAARKAFQGFLPRGSESWEEWVTRNVEALEAEPATYSPKFSDFSFGGPIPLAPYDTALYTGALCYEIRPVTAAQPTYPTANPLSVAAGTSTTVYEDWIEEVVLDLYLNMSETDSTEPMQGDSTSARLDIQKQAEQNPVSNVRICVLEFYGTGVASTFDPDRDPMTLCLWGDLLQRPNPSVGTIHTMFVTAPWLTTGTTAAVSGAGPNFSWFPRAVNSRWRPSMKDGVLINTFASWNNVPHTVYGAQGLRESLASQVTPQPLINTTPSSWEFDVLLDQTVTLKLGEARPSPSGGPSQYASPAMIFKRLDDHRYIQLDIPIKRTIAWNNYNVDGTPSNTYYPTRRFFLCMFCDNSDYAGNGWPFGNVPDAAVGFTQNCRPPRVTAFCAGRIKLLRFQEDVSAGLDVPEALLAPLAANDNDDGGEAAGGRGAKRVGAANVDMASAAGAQSTIQEYFPNGKKPRMG